MVARLGAEARAVLALDQGTTSSRAIVFGRDGAALGQAQAEFAQLFPLPGRVEHDPMEIWRTQLECARGALAAAGVDARELAAIGITNQRETAVVWDRRTGLPIHNAIVWQDRRTTDVCAGLEAAGRAALIAERTGLVIDPYFSATKIAWILDHVAGARARAEAGDLAFGTIDSWLIWNLTRGAAHVTDVGNASRTLLCRIDRAAWDPEMLELFRVPAELLPGIVDSSGVAAEASAEWLGASVPIAGIAGDQQAALFGQACLAPGMAKSTYGTGCFLLANAGEAAPVSRNRLLSTIAWRMGGRLEYALEGSVFIGGAVVQWLRDGLGIIGSSGDVESLAASVADSGGVCFVPAFAGLGAPHWDACARGAIVGLTRGSTAAHIARAALEAIAFQVTDVLRAMEADTGEPIRELRVDGGAARNDLLLQMQADLLQARVVRPACVETTALGAAWLAGLAVGFWRGRDELAATWRLERAFSPEIGSAEATGRRARWAEAIERARGWER